jgi:hemolysin activation/secretion protein
VSLLAASGVAAQVVIPDDRPGDERLELPPLEPPDLEKRRILPPYPMPTRSDDGGVSSGVRVLVNEVRIHDNTVIPLEDLREVAGRYENRSLSFSDLQELRDNLTLVYVERGYVTSGAALPDQTIRDGIVEIHIIEGRLEDIEIQTDGRTRPSYFRARLERGSPGPVNVFALEKRLQLFQQDRRFERVQAQLVPGEKRGRSVLRITVDEAPPYRLGAEFNNYHNPTIGSLGGEVRGGFDNLFGIGDTVFVRGAFTEGLEQVEARFEVPITAYDTLLTFRYQGSWADIIDDDFDLLDISSQSESFGIELRQPVYRTLGASVETFIRAERRRGESRLGLLGIGLPIPGADNGVSKVSVLRFGLDSFYRSRSQVLSARALVSWGIDALGSTHNLGDVPDGRFVSGLIQLQWARRLPWFGAEFIARYNMQLSNHPLLPLEQFSMGGRDTVRGYRENQLVRDNGLVATAELRLPIYERVEPRVRLELIPFVDAGHSWNTSREELGQQTLVSLGLGTRAFVTDWGYMELFWGRRLRDASRAGQRDLQDDGIHFRIAVDWP